MMRTALFTSLLLATATAKNGGNKHPANKNNGNTKKLGGFETFTEANSITATTGTVGHCTITSTTGQTCSIGIAQSFTLTDVYGTSIDYDCSCPSACDSGNAGVGSYTCTITSENYSGDEFCGDVDIASSIFTDIGCSMDIADGTMRCEENCYCDAEAHLCTSEGEECCAGSCVKVTGPGVKGWEFQCMSEEEAEDMAMGNVGGGQKNKDFEVAE